MTLTDQQIQSECQSGFLDSLIKAIGNTAALAGQLDVTLPVLHGWSATGIPPQYHDRVIDFADAHGVIVDRSSLEASYRPPETSREIVLALGGRNDVSAILGASRNAVSNWYETGIPPKYHRRIVLAASELGVPGVTLELLESMHKPHPPRTTRARPAPCATCGRLVAVLDTNEPRPTEALAAT